MTCESIGLVSSITVEMVMIKAKVIEVKRHLGLGTLQLADGTSERFDVAVCQPGIPRVGADVDVEVKLTSRGERRIARLTVESVDWVAGVADEGDHALCFIPPNTVQPVLVTSWRSNKPEKHGTELMCALPHIEQRGHMPIATAVKVGAIPEDARLRIHETLRERADKLNAWRAERLGGPLVPLTRQPTNLPFLSDGGKALGHHPLELPCDLCKTNQGRIYVLEHEQPTELPVGKDVVVCDTCIAAGRVRFRAASEFDAYAANAHPELDATRQRALATALAEKLDRTPDVLPQQQHHDWAVCCDEPQDYIGVPDNDRSFEAFKDGAVMYERGRELAKDQRDDDDITLLEWGSVACFECQRCSKRSFTFQPT